MNGNGGTSALIKAAQSAYGWLATLLLILSAANSDLHTKLRQMRIGGGYAICKRCIHQVLTFR